MLTFSQTGLQSCIIRALDELGFEHPTPVQELSLPHLLTSRTDLLACAQTGTGKTAAFSLPILQQVDSKAKNVQALILCPTRELCLQISKDIQSYAKYMDTKILSVYGGTRIDTQIRALRS